MRTACPALEADAVLCDFSDLKTISKPFPFVKRDQFIRPEFYQSLCETFPTCPPSTGPTGFSLYWGDNTYQELLDQYPVWQALFNTFHSQHFIEWAKVQFAPFWQRSGCKIDLSKARYVPYREDRIDKERATLRKIEYVPEDFWVRMDIHQGREGYSRHVHLDHRRRLISMLIYLYDHIENQIEGGELFLHSADQMKWYHPRPIRITPRHNLMVAFPCMSRSWHSVSQITALAAPRNYLQGKFQAPSTSGRIEVDANRAAVNVARGTHDQEYHYLPQTNLYTKNLSLHPATIDKPGLEESRTKLLSALANDTDITVIRNYGNQGDQLIHAGMRRLLAGIHYREISVLQLEGACGQLAIITGSGAWCQAHQHMPNYLLKIEAQFERVIVFPSSFDISVKSVREALSRTGALVFAREAKSYEQIRLLCRADIAHDTAYFFDFDPYQRSGQGKLLAYRTDGEALTKQLPEGNCDISATCESLDEFLWTIAKYAVVETDRAHVMIAAAMLGKVVHYGESNYHKVSALATFGLQGCPVLPLANVRAQSVREQLLQQARASEQRLPADFVSLHQDCTVTILVLSWGCLEKTCNAIQALQDHVRIPFKVLLLDNGSSTQIQQQLQALSVADARIELILLSENLGCVGGRAAALDHVQSEYVLLIDNDIEVLPGAVEHLLYQLEQHPEAIASTGKVVFPDGSLHLCGATYVVENGVLRFELLGSGQSCNAAINQSGRCDWVPGCLTLFRTACFHHHRYNLGMRYYYEDLEWCYRLNQIGEGGFCRSTEAMAIHYHEEKIPVPSLPMAQRRRLTMNYLESIAHFYRCHGVIIQPLFSFMPELGRIDNPLSIQTGRLLLELINANGGEWVLERWSSGALTPLLAVNTQQSEVTLLRAEVALLRAQLDEIARSKLWRLLNLYRRIRQTLRS